MYICADHKSCNIEFCPRKYPFILKHVYKYAMYGKYEKYFFQCNQVKRVAYHIKYKGGDING